MHSAARGIDRGSGPTGKEVGVGIDKAVNEVIGRINGDPEGPMSIPACRCVSLRRSVWGKQKGRVLRETETECNTEGVSAQAECNT